MTSFQLLYILFRIPSLSSCVYLSIWDVNTQCVSVWAKRFGDCFDHVEVMRGNCYISLCSVALVVVEFAFYICRASFANYMYVIWTFPVIVPALLLIRAVPYH